MIIGRISILFVPAGSIDGIDINIRIKAVEKPAENIYFKSTHIMYEIQ